MLSVLTQEGADATLEALHHGAVDFVPKLSGEHSSDPALLNEIFRAEHTLKGMSATMEFDTMAEPGHMIEAVPDKLRNHELEVTSGIVDVLLNCFDVLEAMVDDIDQGGDVEIDISSLLERLKMYKESKKTSDESRDKGEAPGMAAVRSASSVRIGIGSPDVVMNLVGELVINRSGLIRIGDKYQLRELTETLAMVERIITDLQDEITRMRMIPTDHIFSRFPRLVRDLSKTQKKEIDFIIEGSEIKLDRTVLDKVGDPLLHLLRNAVDHGIEPPGDRVSKGKDRTETIKLIAERERGYVTIKVEDDGKGIDPEERVSKLSDIGALLLVFNPGFSRLRSPLMYQVRGSGWML